MSERWLWHVYVDVLLVCFQLSASVYICPSAFYCLFVPSLYMIVSLQFQWLDGGLSCLSTTCVIRCHFHLFHPTWSLVALLCSRLLSSLTPLTLQPILLSFVSTITEALLLIIHTQSSGAHCMISVQVWRFVSIWGLFFLLLRFFFIIIYLYSFKYFHYFKILAYVPSFLRWILIGLFICYMQVRFLHTHTPQSPPVPKCTECDWIIKNICS